MTFTALTSMLSNRVLVLAKTESTYNTDPVPTPASNALLVSDVDVRIDPNVLERNVVRPSLSPAGITVGRKLVTVTMTHELKGSGAVGTNPAIDPLLKACGFARTTIANTASATIVTPVARTTNAGATVTFAKTTAATATGRYLLTVVKGGASATAKLRVTGSPAAPDETILPNETFSATVGGTSPTMTLTQGLTSAGDYTSITYTVGGSFQAGDILTAVVGGVTFRYTVVSGDTNSDGAATSLAALIDADPRMAASAASSVVTVTFASNAVGVVTTSGTTAINIGGSGAQITPTWTGNLTLADKWDLQVLEPGVHYTPVSDNFDSVTLYIYLDKLFHKVTGCMGNVSFSGEAGAYANASFTFTGQYIPVTDSTIPTGAVYESTLPTQVELAQLNISNKDDFCAQSFSIDMQNQVNPRDCMNNTDGFSGVRLTGRNPQGSVNPEAVREADHPFWANMAAATKFAFHVRVGTTAGNIVKFVGESVQTSSITYGDRNGVRITDIGLRFSQFSDDGNDEVRVIFA